MYMQVDVVVDGALDEMRQFVDYNYMGEFIDQLAKEASDDGLITQVYVIEHHHGIDVDDCECVQFETDHSPAYEWNVEVV